MNANDVQALGDRLLTEHGFGRVPLVIEPIWAPNPGRRANTIFQCVNFETRNYQPLRVEFNSFWVPVLTDDEIQECILHEIAHLYAGPLAMHGPEWARHCVRLGIAPVEFAKSARAPQELIDWIKAGN